MGAAAIRLSWRQASDNACFGCGGNISGQDKGVKEGGGGTLERSQGKGTPSSIAGRCAGQRPTGGPVVSERAGVSSPQREMCVIL